MISKRLILSIGILLFVKVLFVSSSVRVEIDSSSVFKGDTILYAGDTLLKGTVYRNDFSRQKGIFELDYSPVGISYLIGANDTCYMTFSPVFECRGEHKGEDEYRCDSKKFGSNYFHVRAYLRDDDVFYFFGKVGDMIFDAESYKRCGENLAEVRDYDQDIELRAVGGFFIIGLIFFFIIGPYLSNDVEIEKISLLIILICVIVSLLLVVFLSGFTLQQLLLPSICLAVPYSLSRVLRKKRSKLIIHIGGSIVVLLLFGFFQFVQVNDSVTLKDGSSLPLKWRVSTSIPKRIYWKYRIGQMVPVSLNTRGKAYTAYVSKYEFSEPDAEMIYGNELTWFLTLFRNAPLKNCSYSESQLILEQLYSMTGVRLDLPTLEEFLCVSRGRTDVISENEDEDLCRVTRAVSSTDGIVNLLGNVKELTSSYNPTTNIGLAADTMISAYEDVFLSSTKSINKNSKFNNVGFRMIYRPDTVKKRKFRIVGTIRSDKKDFKLPERIELERLNGVCIRKCATYEAFQDVLIKSRFASKTMEVIGPDGAYMNIESPIGYEYYDFTPEFYYE